MFKLGKLHSHKGNYINTNNYKRKKLCEQMLTQVFLSIYKITFSGLIKTRYYFLWSNKSHCVVCLKVSARKKKSTKQQQYYSHTKEIDNRKSYFFFSFPNQSREKSL